MRHPPVPRRNKRPTLTSGNLVAGAMRLEESRPASDGQTGRRQDRADCGSLALLSGVLPFTPCRSSPASAHQLPST